VAWESVSGATSYTLRDGGPAIYTGGGAAYAHIGLVPSSVHSYTVEASNAAGTSVPTLSQIANAPATCPASNLVSQNITLTGTNKIGEILTLSADVQNAGTLATGNFSDDFSYQWNSTGGAWTPVSGGIMAKLGLAAGAISSDSVSFGPLAQSGTLYIQHCVDSYNQVPEGGAETPNCSVSSGTAVSAYSTCGGTVTVNCTLVNNTAHLGTSGTCATGYNGACSYTCTDGVWGAPSSNSCTPPSISEFKICLQSDPTNCTSAFGSRTTATGTPLVASWTASADTCTPVSGPGFTITGSGAPLGSSLFNANSAADITDRYQIGCNYGGGVPAVSWIDVTTLQELPKLTSTATIVRAGSTARLSWDTNNSNETSCTITGGTINGPAVLGNGTLTSETGYEDIVITGRTTFILTCGGLSSVKTIEITPTGWEG
jgi:hypothetical protein